MRLIVYITIRETDESMRVEPEITGEVITIENYGSEIEHVDKEKAETSRRGSLDEHGDEAAGTSTSGVTHVSGGGGMGAEGEVERVHFTCGNPSVTTIHGILHFYKDTSKCTSTFRSDLLCMVGIPTVYTLEDILNFTAPYNNFIRGIRIIKDRSPHSYMALLRFVNEEVADEFFGALQDQRYNSFDDYLCHLVFVSGLEFGKTEIHYDTLCPGPLVELPHCAVCLERLDETTTGMLTVICNHTFHCECMKTCTTCPVCRYLATPPEQSKHTCMVCGNEENLWLCLICGYIGCGRYEGGHARGHFERTNHTYSMCMEERCVWDYVGDNYVHRLIQNKADGKLVAVQDGDGVMADKVHSLTLEYSYLLSQQLESQREYFEKKLLFVEEDAMERIVSVESEMMRLNDEKNKLRREVEMLEKDKRRLESRMENITNKVEVIRKDLSDEQELNKSLRENQKDLVAQAVTAKQALRNAQSLHQNEVTGLKEQISDLMFHFQSQASISNSSMRDEIQNGDVQVIASSSSTPTSNSTNPNAMARDSTRRRSPRKKK